jgi:hypothetical protein
VYRHELAAALAIAFVLVVARSWVFTANEDAAFDSDQAVTGLMAKHLSEGRAFPLFMYGQAYQLTVEAWLAVPVFWLMGPTVAALRTTLVLINLAIAALLIVGLHRETGLRPMLALAPTLFFCLAPPFLSLQLLEAGGGNILPLLYVLGLWLLRRHPIWFGILLGIAFLTREFTIVAVPVVVLVTVRPRDLRSRAVWRAGAAAALAFVTVLGVVYSVHGLSHPFGPGRRGEGPMTSAGSHFSNLANRANPVLTELPERTRVFVVERVPELLGARTAPSPVGEWGQEWLAVLLAIVASVGIVRMIVLARLTRGRTMRSMRPPDSFAWYLLGVGTAASAAYVMARPADAVVHRYFLLAVYVPVGFFALWLIHEPHRRWRAAIVAALLVWTTAAAVENWRLYDSYASGRQRNYSRAIARALEARGVRVAAANYWRAYKITFLTQERIRIASEDFVRIDEYQKLAEAEGDQLRRLRDWPCDGGEPVGTMYLCR